MTRSAHALLVLLISVGGVTGAETVRIQGSSALAEKLAPLLEATSSTPETEWRGVGSGGALIGLLSSAADLGVSMRSLDERERELAAKLGVDLRERVLALDALAVIVHPQNTIDRLTLDQLSALYNRTIVRWIGVGGPENVVRPLGLPSFSGYARFIQESLDDRRGGRPFSPEIVGSAEEMIQRVAADRDAIGYVSMSYDRSAVRTLSIAGAGDGNPVTPTVRTVSSGRYPLAHPVRLYSLGEPRGPTRRLVAFLLLPEGQRLVSRAGFVPLCATQPVAKWADLGTPVVREALLRIPFGFRGSRLGPAEQTSLSRLATRLIEGKEDLWIVGHSEPTESEGIELSEARAAAVAELLRRQGVPSERLRHEGLGIDEPAASNTTLEGRRENRRADLWILPR